MFVLGIVLGLSFGACIGVFIAGLMRMAHE